MNPPGNEMLHLIAFGGFDIGLEDRDMDGADIDGVQRLAADAIARERSRHGPFLLLPRSAVQRGRGAARGFGFVGWA